LAVSLALLAALAPAASAAPKTLVNTLGGEAFATAGGLFSEPKGVAVNESGAGGVAAGTFYVVDAQNKRIQQFSPTGAFVRTWGWGVRNGEEEFEVCSVADKCRNGLNGNGAGQLNTPQGIAVDQAGGTVYVSDQAQHRVDVYSASGAFEGAFGWSVDASAPAAALQFCTTAGGCQAGSTGAKSGQFGAQLGYLTVDPTSGDVVVAGKTNRRIDVFQPSFAGGVVTAVSYLRGFGWGVATGAAAFQVCTTNCRTPAAAGAQAGNFATNSPTDVAVDSEGDYFTLDAGNKRVQEFDSTPAPLATSFGGAALTAAFGTGPRLHLSIDPSVAPNDLLVSGADSANGERVAVVELDHAGNALQTDGSDLTTTESGGLAVAESALGGNVYLTGNGGGTSSLLVLNEPPTIDPVTVFTASTATFSGSVVSNGFDVGYQFEYSLDGRSWTKVPAAEVDAGIEAGTIAVQGEATGLTGSQLYRVRLAQNRALGGGRAVSTETTFTTSPAAPGIAGLAAGHLTDTTATLSAQLNPQNEATTYHFEYGTGDCALLPCTALPDLQAGGGPLPVAQNVTGLAPDTVYHFRLVAANATGTETSAVASFRTFAPGASLPDDRAYELVSPVDANGVPPILLIGTEGLGANFETQTIAVDGESALFNTTGTLPGSGGNGGADQYRSVRGADGWSTETTSPSGAQTEHPHVGGVSSDLRYAFWRSGEGGALSIANAETTYLRLPDGSFELVGSGSLGTQAQVQGWWISAGAGHVIFSATTQLEPEAPAGETTAIYDRTPGGPTTVVSVKPGGESFAEFENAEFQGVSRDGSAVAFTVGETLFVHSGGSTVEVAAGFPTFAGLSTDGDRLLYTLGGDIFSFDVASQTTTPVGSGAESTVVNVSADGSHVYFSSPQQLDGSNGEAGAPNLYVWNGSTVRFVAVLDPRDFFEPESLSEELNLGAWVPGHGPNQGGAIGPASDPSRTTADGDVLVFQSHASLAPPFDNQGHWQIFRYVASTEALSCVSCSPISPKATADANLQASRRPLLNQDSPVNAETPVASLTADGQRVFFQTSQALLPGDSDGVQDVYEWEEGRLSLISSGQSGANSYLYGVSPDGRDVLFTTHDTLVPRDRNGGTSRIYDARVGGGFDEPAETVPCAEEGCQPQPTPPPPLAGGGSTTFQGPGNPKPPARHRKRHKHRRHRRPSAHKQGTRSGNGGAK
jgi:hypothetical protein